MEDELIIEAGRSKKHYWKDLWRYRELFYILSWRDIKVRYKQTVIGAAWAVLRPLITMVVLTLTFGKMANAEAKYPLISYPIIVLAGTLPWQFFSTALSEASNSLIGNTNLVSKVYFPRMIIPASSVITSLIDFGISFVLLIIFLVIYRTLPPLKMLWLPAFVLLCFLAAFGIGLYITALNVKYRDFRYIVPFIVQFGLFLSPVGLPSDSIEEKYGEMGRLLYSLNPMVGIIDGFRWCILDMPMYWPGLFISLIITIGFLFIGVVYFRRTEKTFADNI